MEIIPAILPKTFAYLKKNLSLVNGLAPIVQIDSVDGSLTTSKCWPYDGDDEDFKKILSGEIDFPFPETDFEVDLMVKNPELFIENWLVAGAKRIVVHFESSDDISKAANIFHEKAIGSDNILLKNDIGLALNIQTENEKIYPFLPQFDFVQFMGIEKIGYQGNPFSEKVLNKISAFRKEYPEAIISVDGGVSLDNAEELKDAGANRLIIGSAIFESGDIRETIEEFKKI